MYLYIIKLLKVLFFGDYVKAYQNKPHFLRSLWPLLDIHKNFLILFKKTQHTVY
jgi:hypothetical protein